MRGAERPIRRVSLLGFALVLMLGGAEAAGREAERGQRLFQEKCVACHTIGQGERVGPDLAGVTARRSHPWLNAWISAPDRILAQGDPVARELLEKYKGVPMPNQGLTVDEVVAIMAYLGSEPGAVGAAGAPATSPGPAGDPAIGKELFAGARRFASQGPPCMACHSIAGLGALGGGALGPDLTLAAAKFGEAGLGSILSGMPFPTMNPIYSRHPLTPEEQAHVRAFIGQAGVAARSPSAIGRLAGLAAVGAALGLALAHVSWRRRLTGGVRRRVVAAPTIPSASARARRAVPSSMPHDRRS